MSIKQVLIGCLVGALCLGGALSARAYSELEICNQTGYYISAYKIVNSKGLTVASGKGLSHGKSQKNTLLTGGEYTLFIALFRDGKTVYAKGEPTPIPDWVEAELMLKEVLVGSGDDQEGGIKTISKDEFDRK